MDLYRSDTGNQIHIENNDQELITLYLLDLENTTFEESMQSLVTHFASYPTNLLPDGSSNHHLRKDLYQGIKNNLHGLIQTMSQCPSIIPTEHETLISFDRFHELYKSIPNTIVNRFQDLAMIRIHYHLCCQFYAGQSSTSPIGTLFKLTDLEFDDVLKFPNGDTWYCIDDGNYLNINSFSSLIAVLEANKKATQCLQRLYRYLGDVLIIMIDEITVHMTNGQYRIYTSIEDFMTDFLTIPGYYRYKYDWYWRVRR